MEDTTAGHWGVRVSGAGGNTSKTKSLAFLSFFNSHFTTNIPRQLKISAPGPLDQCLVLNIIFTNPSPLGAAASPAPSLGQFLWLHLALLATKKRNVLDTRPPCPEF